MERKTNQVSSSVALVAVMVAFLSALFMADATLSEAASGKATAQEERKTAVDHTESRIKQLNSALKITPDQEGLWNDLTLVMRENAKTMEALTVDRREKAQAMNAVERMKFHSRITEAQLDQQRKFIPPFEALYASLSDVQKASTDAIFRTGKHGKHKIR